VGAGLAAAGGTAAAGGRTALPGQQLLDGQRLGAGLVGPGAGPAGDATVVATVPIRLIPHRCRLPIVAVCAALPAAPAQAPAPAHPCGGFPTIRGDHAPVGSTRLHEEAPRAYRT
jgi:hypothetical protein